MVVAAVVVGTVVVVGAVVVLGAVVVAATVVVVGTVVVVATVVVQIRCPAPHGRANVEASEDVMSAEVEKK